MPILFIALLATLAVVGASCRISTDLGSTGAGEVAGEDAEGNLVGEDVVGEGGGAEDVEGNVVGRDGDAEDGGAGDPAESGDAVSAPPQTELIGDWCGVPGIDGPSGLVPEAFDEFAPTAAERPVYQLNAAIDPLTGGVEGRGRITLPPQAVNEADWGFRVFAGMDAFDSGLRITDVTVNGNETPFELDRALLTIDNVSENQTTERPVVELSFAYEISEMAANEDIFAALSGESLQPDQVGLLGRTPTGMQLGHWFPVWLPDGVRSDADPSGFGDIGAFPSASICAALTVDPAYRIITGGESDAAPDTTVIEGAMGLRDLSVLLSNDLAMVSETVDGVDIRVFGPPDDPEAMDLVLDYSVESFIALSQAFGPYPFTELDVVSAPLGSGVGGMEWPGMIWIERSMFAGGLPGLGDLGELFDDEELGGLLDGFGGEALATTLEWTVAHEVAHEWWHATVGNDSIASPAVDEPLAQFSACIAMQRIHPDNWRDICEAQTIDTFGQYLGFGVTDAAADQPSDAFDSSLQYGAVVYGKAPGFYLEAGDLIGWDILIAALRDFVDANRFELVGTETLKTHLVDAAGDDGPEVDRLWDRWFSEARGAEDIESSSPFGSLGGLEGLEGLENFNPDDLDAMMDMLESFGGIDGLEGLEGLEDLEGFDELLEELLGG